LPVGQFLRRAVPGESDQMLQPLYSHRPGTAGSAKQHHGSAIYHFRLLDKSAIVLRTKDRISKDESPAAVSAQSILLSCGAQVRVPCQPPNCCLLPAIASIGGRRHSERRSQGNESPGRQKRSHRVWEPGGFLLLRSIPNRCHFCCVLGPPR